MKTFTPKPADLTHDWYVIDATDVVLGRLATQAATLLRGKNKPTYAPHADSGNHVIILNADKIALTGNKLGKELYMHSGRPGGLRRDSYAQLLKTKQMWQIGVVNGLVQEPSGQGSAGSSPHRSRCRASVRWHEAAGFRDRSGLAAG